MDIDKPIVDFLREPQNISLAIEIAGYVEKLKEDLHREFWETVNKKMLERENASEIPKNWQLVPFPMGKIRSSHWQRVHVQPIIKPKPPFFLQMVLGQTSGQGNYTLVRGVAWNKKVEDWSHPNLEALTSKLKLKGFTRGDNWWPSYELYKSQLEGPEFMVQMANDMNAAVDEILNDWWELFLEIRPLMEEVNQAISEKQ